MAFHIFSQYEAKEFRALLAESSHITEILSRLAVGGDFNVWDHLDDLGYDVGKGAVGQILNYGVSSHDSYADTCLPG